MSILLSFHQNSTLLLNILETRINKIPISFINYSTQALEFPQSVPYASNLLIWYESTFWHHVCNTSRTLQHLFCVCANAIYFFLTKSTACIGIIQPPILKAVRRMKRELAKWIMWTKAVKLVIPKIKTLGYKMRQLKRL